jgi:type II secretory pathway component PulM
MRAGFRSGPNRQEVRAMVDLLDQSLNQGGVDQLARPAEAAPPKQMPDIERHVKPRWPRNAKIVTAVLAVLALAGVFGTAWQYFNDDSSDYQAQISDLTDQRNALVIQNGNLRTDVNGLEEANAQLSADKAQYAADNAQFAVDNAQLQAQYDAISADLVAAQNQNSTLSTEMAVATRHIVSLDNQINGLEASNETVTAERDALAAMFPMLVDTSLVGVDVAGTYAVKWFPAYNSGLPDIALPGVTQVVISNTDEGWLQVRIPGVLTAGLLGTDGALSTVVDTTTAVPPMNGVARTARVAVTIYAGATVTAADGTTTVTELGMSVVTMTPAAGDAPAGLALYGAALTPQA